MYRNPYLSIYPPMAINVIHFISQKLPDGRYIPAGLFLTVKRVGKTDETSPIVKFLPNFTEGK